MHWFISGPRERNVMIWTLWMETAAPATVRRSHSLTVLVSVERNRKCISSSLQPSVKRLRQKCGTLLHALNAVRQFWLTVLRDVPLSHSGGKSIFESSTLGVIAYLGSFIHSIHSQRYFLSLALWHPCKICKTFNSKRTH